MTTILGLLAGTAIFALSGVVCRLLHWEVDDRIDPEEWGLGVGVGMSDPVRRQPPVVRRHVRLTP